MALVRGLERSICLIFSIGVAAFIAGVLMAIENLPLEGSILLVFSALTLLFGIGWMIRLVPESSCKVSCPYCNAINDLYRNRGSFHCDACHKLVFISHDVNSDSPEFRRNAC